MEELAMVSFVPLAAQEAMMASWWAGAICQTGVVAVLLGVIIYFLRRLVASLDNVTIKVTAVDRSQAITETKLDDHIENDALHCKGANCVRG